MSFYSQPYRHHILGANPLKQVQGTGGSRLTNSSPFQQSLKNANSRVHTEDLLSSEVSSEMTSRCELGIRFFQLLCVFIIIVVQVLISVLSIFTTGS